MTIKYANNRKSHELSHNWDMDFQNGVFTFRIHSKQDNTILRTFKSVKEGKTYTYFIDLDNDKVKVAVKHTDIAEWFKENYSC